jgi:hypothetical protein
MPFSRSCIKGAANTRADKRIGCTLTGLHGTFVHFSILQLTLLDTS